MVADERWYFMKEKLQRFMWGRYGNDRFNQFLMIVALVCLALLSAFRTFKDLIIPVPRHKGKIAIHCRKCGEEFIRKT